MPLYLTKVGYQDFVTGINGQIDKIINEEEIHPKCIFSQYKMPRNTPSDYAWYIGHSHTYPKTQPFLPLLGMDLVALLVDCESKASEGLVIISLGSGYQNIP